MNGEPSSVNSTTFTDPAGPLGLSAGSAVTLSTREFGQQRHVEERGGLFGLLGIPKVRNDLHGALR